MKNSSLIWKVLEKKKLLHTPVFDVINQKERAEAGIEGDYIAIEANDWVLTIPVIDDSFVMVRQWRHALEAITMEFPGGVANRDEDIMTAAARELEEETGYKPGRMTHLASLNPNPGLFKNRYHIFLAENLIQVGEQRLDDDELLSCKLVKIEDVIENFGTGEYINALMVTAMALYLKYIRNCDSNTGRLSMYG